MEKAVRILSAVLVTASLGGCGPFTKLPNIGGGNLLGTLPSTPPSLELRGFLPTQEGFVGTYHGTAEYGHQEELVALDEAAGEARYLVRGEVYDASGGEAPGDHSLKLRYTVRGDVLSRTLLGAQRLMDNRFPELELLKAPLNLQTQWTQTVRDQQGAEVTLDCRVTADTTVDGRRTVTVRYQARGGPYFEERTFRQGAGVVSLTMPFISGRDRFEIGYALADEFSGLRGKLELEAYLPPLGKLLRYHGLAEYAHEGTLHKVSANDVGAVYEFRGELTDGTALGGNIAVRYLVDYAAGTVTEQVVSNSRTGRKEVNSLLHDPIILKLPLTAGQSWTQTVTVKGQARTMTATVITTGVSPLSHFSPVRPLDRWKPYVTVRYVVEGVSGFFEHTYVEERTFQQGVGMTGFQSLMPGAISMSAAERQDPWKVNEIMLLHTFGYGLAKYEVFGD
ncbi:MAG: hypothetical protein AB1492_03940 [Bacillota bacterium]